MRLLRAAMILEALLLLVGGILCVALPALISTPGKQPAPLDTYIRCALGFALISLAILLLQATRNVAKFRSLLLTSSLLTVAWLVGLATVNVVYGFGRPYQLWSFASFCLGVLLSIVVLGHIDRLATKLKPRELDPWPRKDTLLHQVKMKYAWDWFQYHADQRLKAFNFFLVILGILVVAYGAAMKESLAIHVEIAKARIALNDKPGTALNDKAGTALNDKAGTALNDELAELANWYTKFAVGIASCGLVIPIAFLLVEIRNTELVQCGRRWLDSLENGLEMTVRKDDKHRVCFPLAVDKLTAVLILIKPFIKHYVMFRAVYFLACLGFFFALIHACHRLK